MIAAVEHLNWPEALVVVVGILALAFLAAKS